MNDKSELNDRDSAVDVKATAAAWLSRRDAGMNPSETAELRAWLEENPRHAAAFEELEEVWGNFDELRAARHQPGQAPAENLAATQSRRRQTFWRSSAWATCAVAAGLAVILVLRPAPHSAETVVGAFQRVDLPDGSIAQLNTDSAIDIEFTARERHVSIARGEVFFNVQKDAARPFIVTAGPVSVKAIGTAFNVRRRIASVDVLVTEGKVRVDESRRGRNLLPETTSNAGPSLLQGGERASIHVTGGNVVEAQVKIEKVPVEGAQRMLAWQEHRLEFENVPLSEVIEEFNRYNKTKMVSEDPGLAQTRFSGTFRPDGLEALVLLLEENFGARAVRSGGKIYLSPRSP